jgi:sucrose-6-phosphate hydrolase SacC (GH32 family)
MRLPVTLLLAPLVLPCLAQGDMRPAFHFTAQKNWLNDPNGLVWHDGEYHLFYQYNPFGDTWGHMSWGHAVSPDLMTWEELPVAIPEKDGIMAFSGSAVVDHQNTSGFGEDGKPPMVAVYTGHREGNQSQRIAYSNDKGRTWTDYENNPVLDIGMADFRDPKVFWHAPTKRWIMVVALSLERKVSFYGSPDLKKWNLLSHFGPAGAVKGIWECPDLFELPVEGTNRKRWVLNINLGDHSIAGGSGAQYFTGTFNGRTFTADPIPGADAKPEAFLRGSRVLADFEDDFQGWQLEGEAFGEEPSAGTAPGQHPVVGFQGKGLVNGYGRGDGPTGTMTSPEFKLSKPHLGFLLGGGNDPETLSASLIVDDKVVRSATGRNSEEMFWVSWPVGEFAGKSARLQLVDRESGEWGHLLFDHLVLSDHPAPPIGEHANWVDHGPDFYAAITWDDAPPGIGGRPWIGWMSNWKYAGQTPTSPWRSAMSLPRTLSLRRDSDRFTLIQTPVPTLDSWRGEPLRLSNMTISEANAKLADLRGKRFDIRLRIRPENADEAGIKLRVGDGEETLVGWSRPGGEVFVDRTKSGNTGFHPDFSGRHGAPLELKDGTVELRIVSDDCSVEVFADDGAVSITDLIFPSDSSDRLEIYNKGGEAEIEAAIIFPLTRK